MTRPKFFRPSTLRPVLLTAIALVAGSVLALAPTPRMASAAEFSYSQLSVNRRAACAVTSTGIGVCWGDNSGQYLLPNMPSGRYITPVKISLPNSETFATIDTGENNTVCAQAVSGRAYCWGDHHIGSYFTTTSRVPIQVEFPHDMRVTNVQSGYANGCALDPEQYLWCWGDALTLGDGNSEPIRIPTQVPMPDGGKVVQYDMGPTNTCVVTHLSHLYCWGENGDGELALGYASNIPYNSAQTPTLISPPTGITFASASVGLHRICALSTTGTGFCWGDNYEGSFGNNTYLDSLRPTAMVVPDNETLLDISTGWYHTCVQTISNKTWCFGNGGFGELGSGTTMGGKTYRAPYVPTGTQFHSVDAGLAVTCALNSENHIWCWGGPNWRPSEQVYSGLLPAAIPAIGSPNIINPITNSLGTTTAQVQADVTAFGSSTTTMVEYDTDPHFGSPNRISSTSMIVDGILTATPIAINIYGLLPHTTYHYRFIATNAYGSAISLASSLITLGQAPAISAIAFSVVTGNELTASFDVDPGRLSTSINFEYATDANFSVERHIIALTGAAGSRPVSRTAVLIGLVPQQMYFTRIVATNQLGTTTGATQTIGTVGSLPSVELISATANSRSITLEANITTGLTKGSVIAQASLTDDFGSTKNSTTSSFTSAGPTQHELVINNLLHSNHYFVRISVTNDVGTVTSTTTAVVTTSGLPSIADPVINPETTSAVITNEFNTDGYPTLIKMLVSESASMIDATEYFVFSGVTQTTQTTWTTVNNLAMNHQYFVVIQAHNVNGDVATSPMSFNTLTPVGFLINDGATSTDNASVVLTFNLPSETSAIRISNSPDFRNAQVISPTTLLTWQLQASSETSVERTIWVQSILSDGNFESYSGSITLVAPIDPIIGASAKHRAGAKAAPLHQTKTKTKAKAKAKAKTKAKVKVKVKAKAKAKPLAPKKIH